MDLPDKVQNMLAEPLNCYALSVFSTTWKGGMMTTSLSSVLSYCCDNLEAKFSSCTRHSARMQRLFGKFLFLVNDSQDQRTDEVRTDTGTRRVQNRLKDLIP